MLQPYDFQSRVTPNVVRLFSYNAVIVDYAINYNIVDISILIPANTKHFIAFVQHCPNVEHSTNAMPMLCVCWVWYELCFYSGCAVLTIYSYSIVLFRYEPSDFYHWTTWLPEEDASDSSGRYRFEHHHRQLQYGIEYLCVHLLPAVWLCVCFVPGHTTALLSPIERSHCAGVFSDDWRRRRIGFAEWRWYGEGCCSDAGRNFTRWHFTAGFRAAVWCTQSVTTGQVTRWLCSFTRWL